MGRALRVAIITALPEDKGLARDGEILRRTLADAGHYAVVIDYRDVEPAAPRGSFDVVLFCEVMEVRFRLLLRPGGRVWYMPNLEWHQPEKIAAMAWVDLVLCKTPDAAAYSWGARSVYVGFESADLFPARFAPDGPVLHPSGGSYARGTMAVVRAWRIAAGMGMPDGVRLCLVNPPRHPVLEDELASSRGIEIHPRLPADEFLELQRRSRIHVIPSECEGWGHLFWEALSLGATVVATAGPWWSKAAGAYVAVRAEDAGTRNCARLLHVAPVDLARAILDAYRGGVEAGVTGQREAWMRQRDEFRAALLATVEREGELMAA